VWIGDNFVREREGEGFVRECGLCARGSEGDSLEFLNGGEEK